MTHDKDSSPDPLPYNADTVVSVAIPVYNGGDYLEETLSSIIRQSHPTLDIVIVDDYSSDNSRKIANRFREQDSRIRLIQNDETLGMIGNWNRAISACTGEWIQLIGQDDLLEPRAIETMLQMARKDIRLLIGSRAFEFEHDADQSLRNTYIHELPTLNGNGIPSGVVTPETVSTQILNLLNPCTNFMGEPVCGLVRKDVYDDKGLYHPEMSQLGDYEFWLRCVLDEPFVFVDETLFTFRVHGNSATHDSRKNPVKGIHLESARLLMELLNSPRLHDARQRFPDLISRWEEQLAFDITTLKKIARKDPEAALQIQKICDQTPFLKSRFAQAYPFYRIKRTIRHIHSMGRSAPLHITRHLLNQVTRS